MNLLALLLALYAFGGLATFAYFMSIAPEGHEPGMASPRTSAARSAILSVLWPVILAVLALAYVFPPLWDWIENGSK